MSWDIVSHYAAGLKPGSPDQRGYRDGVTAAWRRAQKAKAVDPEIIRCERTESAEQRRRVAENDRPY
ncbi:hypothetical protein J2S40_000183 [Nocardioides luteus]|nr:hypothetical protein [Nocardioides luteus]MDR7309125.1 hypothetical protein [Nocardioides luteus]